ncbi:MAG: hypothetical protein Tsb0018_00650 [Opitutales bacterium]
MKMETRVQGILVFTALALLGFVQAHAVSASSVPSEIYQINLQELKETVNEPSEFSESSKKQVESYRRNVRVWRAILKKSKETIDQELWQLIQVRLNEFEVFLSNYEAMNFAELPDSWLNVRKQAYKCIDLFAQEMDDWIDRLKDTPADILNQASINAREMFLGSLPEPINKPLDLGIIRNACNPGSYLYIRYLPQQVSFEIAPVLSDDKRGLGDPINDVHAVMLQSSSAYVLSCDKSSSVETDIEVDEDYKGRNAVCVNVFRVGATLFLSENNDFSMDLYLPGDCRETPKDCIHSGALEDLVNQEAPPQSLLVPGNLPLVLSYDQMHTLLSDFNTEEAPPVEEDDYESAHIDAQEESPVIEAVSNDFGKEEDEDNPDGDDYDFADGCIFSQEDDFLSLREESKEDSVMDLGCTLLSGNSDEWALGDEISSEVFDIESSVGDDKEGTSVLVPMDDKETASTHTAIDNDQANGEDTEASGEKAPTRESWLGYLFGLFGV